MPHLPHFFYIITQIYLVWSTGHEAPHYAVFSSPVTYYLFGPNLFLSTPFLNTLNLCLYFNITDQVLHLGKTTGKISVATLNLYALTQQLEE
jgi:hypothetical protein